MVLCNFYLVHQGFSHSTSCSHTATFSILRYQLVWFYVLPWMQNPWFYKCPSQRCHIQWKEECDTDTHGKERRTANCELSVHLYTGMVCYWSIVKTDQWQLLLTHSNIWHKGVVCSPLWEWLFDSGNCTAALQFNSGLAANTWKVI